MTRQDAAYVAYRAVTGGPRLPRSVAPQEVADAAHHAAHERMQLGGWEAAETLQRAADRLAGLVLRDLRAHSGWSPITPVTEQEWVAALTAVTTAARPHPTSPD